MDDHAARWANRLLGNPDIAPVLELLLQGAKLEALRDIRIAVTGADATPNVPMWRAVGVAHGQRIEFPRNRSGVWCYLAVAGGFTGPAILGSVSAYPRGGIGSALAAGDALRAAGIALEPPRKSGDTSPPFAEHRNYDAPPLLRVWPGPQWDLFSPAGRDAFFAESWCVTSQSDRVGYRLEGPRLPSAKQQIISEPMLPGTVQIPENGQPIVTMRDGPTVGGYPKLGVLDPNDISWLAQCRPHQTVRFRLVS
jgi:biotin-dependent carboxylase-like uncharacterized protein